MLGSTRGEPLHRRIFSVDGAVAAGGLALAAAAAFFPWYVFFHQEKFGIRPMQYSNGRPLSDWPGTGLYGASPLAMTGTQNVADIEFDPLATAAVPDGDAPDIGKEDALEQPFPGESEYALLHVANGRALIEDDGGIYIVRVGSVLPDSSRLEAFERHGRDWVIVTSNGKVIGP